MNIFLVNVNDFTSTDCNSLLESSTTATPDEVANEPAPLCSPQTRRPSS